MSQEDQKPIEGVIDSTLNELDVATLSRHTLLPGQTTGMHQHRFDYVVVPLTDGIVTIDAERGAAAFAMQRATPYSRKAGIIHSITNTGSSVVDFIEVEFHDADSSENTSGAND